MRRWSFDYEYGFYSYLEGLISFQIILYLFIYLILPVFKFLTLSFMFIRSKTSVQETMQSTCNRLSELERKEVVSAAWAPDGLDDVPL